MSDKQALIDQIDRKIEFYEIKLHKARKKYDISAKQEDYEEYIQTRGKMLGLGEARKLILLIL